MFGLRLLGFYATAEVAGLQDSFLSAIGRLGSAVAFMDFVGGGPLFDASWMGADLVYAKIRGVEVECFKEKPGVISPGACWVAFANERMFCCETIGELLTHLMIDWNDEQILVG